MKKLRLLAVLSALSIGTGLFAAPLSEKVADSFIIRYPSARQIHWGSDRNSFTWQTGYVMFAMEHLWNMSGNEKYFDYIRTFAEDRVQKNGDVPDFSKGALDNFIPGYALLLMYEKTGDKKYLKAVEHIRDGFRDYPRAENGMFHHNRGTNEVWVDGVFMGQMFLSRYAAVTGHREDFEEVVRQIRGIFSLCGREDGLLYHAWGPRRGHTEEVWSEGLGWVAVLLADVFDYLPEDFEGYDEIKGYAVRMCEGLKGCQDPSTGMWCQVVDKPLAPGNWNETSGTGMFIYLMKRCLDRGWLPAEYKDVIIKAYGGIRTKARVNADGGYNLLDCSSIGVQRDYEAYISQPREISTFAAFASFILGTGIVEHDKDFFRGN